MVTRGRNICNTLKAIRKLIADANNIDYSPEECHFKGECNGTCPKCEQDVRTLEYKLRLQQMAGKAIKVAGVATGLIAITACSDGKSQRNVPKTLAEEPTTLHEDSIDPTMFNGEIDHTRPIKQVYVTKFTPPQNNKTDCPSSTSKRVQNYMCKDNDKTKGKLSQQNNIAIVQPAISIDSTESSKIFDNADEEASFPGGIAACMKYIADNFRYPNIQGDCSIQGKIVVSFIVNEDGNLNDIKVKKSVYSDLDKEAVRVVKSMPKWNPAKQKGKAVKTRYTLPITIRLQ